MHNPEVHLLDAVPFRMSHNRPRDSHRLPTWLLEMFTVGQLSVSVEGLPWRTFGMAEGILYAPDTAYRERIPVRGGVCESLCLFFTLDDALSFDAWKNLAPPYRVIDDSLGQLMPLIQQSVRHHGLPGVDALLAQGAFLQILGLLLSAATVDDTLIVAGNPSGEDLVTRLHRHMRANLGKPLTLARLAEAMDMSVSGLAHAYRRLTNQSPMMVLRRMRIDAARTHLDAGRLSLAEIADLTGFADAFHLSRTFKQIVGLSPRDYRNK